MSSNARRTVLFPEPESPVSMTSWRDSRLERGFKEGERSILYPPLMCAGYPHVFSVFRNRSSRYADACIFQLLCDLIVGQWVRGILFINHFLHKAFQREQRHSSALGPIHCLAKKGP